MKNVKNMLQVIALFVMVAMAQTSVAQNAQPAGPGGGGGRMEERKKKMEEIEAKLNLTPEQSAKIAEIKKRSMESVKSKMMALPADASREEKGKIMKDAMASADQEIMELLNSEQQVIYKAEKEKLKTEMKEKRQERKKG